MSSEVGSQTGVTFGATAAVAAAETGAAATGATTGATTGSATGSTAAVEAPETEAATGSMAGVAAAETGAAATGATTGSTTGSFFEACDAARHASISAWWTASRALALEVHQGPKSDPVVSVNSGTSGTPPLGHADVLSYVLLQSSHNCDTMRIPTTVNCFKRLQRGCVVRTCRKAKSTTLGPFVAPKFTSGGL
jgi:hypothetical protein